MIRNRVNCQNQFLYISTSSESGDIYSKCGEGKSRGRLGYTNLLAKKRIIFK
jgi:hypothetical protein